MEHLFCHHEIPADDPVRASNFYKSVFDWKIQDCDMDTGPYYMFNTGEKGVGGGIFKKTDEYKDPCSYIHVDSIPVFCEKI